MKPLLVPLVLLCASTALGAPPREIAFEITGADSDSFTLTNTSPGGLGPEIWRIFIRPPTEYDVTSLSDLVELNSAPFNSGNVMWYSFSNFEPGQWATFSGAPPAGTIEVYYIDVNTLNRGAVFAPIQNGTFEGWTVPEPATWLLAIGAMACIVAWRRRAGVTDTR